MKGDAKLVVNNAAFVNQGNFAEGQGTVKLTGIVDTTISFVGGNTTTFYNLSAVKSSYGVALKAHSKVRNILNVSGGTLYTDSNLTLLSDTNLTARVDVIPSGCNIIGKSNVERYIPGRRAWRLITAPVTGSNTFFKSWQNNGVYEAGKGTFITGPGATGTLGNGLDPSPQNNYSVRGFNYTTQGFTNLSNTHAPVSAGSSGSADNTGYFMFVRGDRVYSNFSLVNHNTTTLTSIGSLQVGTQVFQTSKDSAKYTLIGNPFASPVDFNNVVRNNIVKRLFVFDPRLGDLGIWVMLDDIDGDGIFTKSIGASEMTNHIQSSQAFFVQTSGNVVSASLTFNETCKSDGNNNKVFRPSGTNKIEAIRTTINLLNSDGSTLMMDGAISEFNDNFTTRPTLEDASKIVNTYENVAVLRNNLTFTAERRPTVTSNDTIYLRVWKTTQRKYQLKFEPENFNKPGLQAFLEDLYLGTSTPVSLTNTTTYNYEVTAVTASANTERFRIVFKPAVVLPVTLTNVNAFEKGESIQVVWNVENEINISKYEIEKSTDGVNFAIIGNKNVVGSNNRTNSYQWIDQSKVEGNNFYRIKIYDLSGQIRYSNIVKVMVEKYSGGITIYPNPIKNSTINLQFKNQETGKYSFRVTNNLGQLIHSSTEYIQLPNTMQIIKLNSKLTSGMYPLEIIHPDNHKTVQKLIVE